MAAFNFPNSPSTNQTHTENGVTWKWDGEKWVRVEGVGAQGGTGAQGHQGVQGAAAAAGAQGAQGHQGVQGAPGAQGAAGAQGAQGASGSATISNNADNRVITGGSGSNLNGEANLLFDGTTLSTGGSGTGTLINIGDDGVNNTKILQIKRSSSRTTIPNIQGVEAGVGAGHFELQGEGGNVSIGDVVPTAKLHVVGSVRITSGIKDKDNTSGSAGEILTSTGSQIEWKTPAAAGSGIVKQIVFTKGPSSQTSYNSSSWTTVISRAITMQDASNNVLVTVTHGLYGGDEGNTYRGGRLLRNTSTIWEASSIWGRAGTLKAEQSGLQIIDNPGSGTSTYHFQLREHDSSGSNNVIIFPNNCQISVMEYTP